MLLGLLAFNTKIIYFQSSIVMITNFKVGERLCKKHELPESFVCLGKNCSTHSLLCINCVKKEHPHLSSVHSMGNFITYFSQFMAKAKERLEKDGRESSITSVLRAKKQEIEQLHLELIEKIMKRLSDEKKAILQSLDSLEREFREKESLFLKNHQQRVEIINYLLPYAENSELLELKLKTTSGWGLTRLKQYLTDLETLTNNFDKSSLSALESSAACEASQKLDGTLFKSLARIIKEQSVLVKPPLPQRVYSFSQRRGLSGLSRPCSSFEKKSASVQSGSTKTHSVRQF